MLLGHSRVELTLRMADYKDRSHSLCMNALQGICMSALQGLVSSGFLLQVCHLFVWLVGFSSGEV